MIKQRKMVVQNHTVPLEKKWVGVLELIYKYIYQKHLSKLGELHMRTTTLKNLLWWARDQIGISFEFK